MSSELESVPDSLLLAISSYLGVDELITFELVSKRTRKLDLASLWEDLCDKRWKDWPRYRWVNLRNSHPVLVSKNWKERFLWVEKDHSRKILPRDELLRLQWFFNFTPNAGGRGWETLRRCWFHGEFLFVPSYPPLRYRLIPPGNGDGPQKLEISNFPSHTIERLTHNGEWIIKNENVTFVSCHETEELVFKDRGFQDRN